MSDPKLISPMLDNFIMGGPISDHHGIRSCPAMENDTDDKYIVKVISVPASQTQLDALILTGAYADEAAAMAYFMELTNDIVHEVQVLEKLSELDGFIPFTAHQVVTQDSEKGYDIYLLSPYKKSLQKYYKSHTLTHLDALNLGLDLCASLAACRRNGYLYVDLKASNVFVTGEHQFKIGDLGFIRLDSLKFASMPEKYMSEYTPPEICDAFSPLNTTIDIYAAGLILYQAYNNGELPITNGHDSLPSPLYADYEMSEIILKACATNPEDRWQDPLQFGQAIVSYMQRNGALDEPIVPAPVTAPEQLTEESIESLSNDQVEVASNPDEIEHSLQSAPELLNAGSKNQDCSIVDADLPEINDESASDNESTAPIFSDEADSPENEYENLTFLSDASGDDSVSAEEDLNYSNISDDVVEMLSQADELATASVPAPVVVPDYVEIPMPDPIEREKQHTDSKIDEEQPCLENVDSSSTQDINESTVEQETKLSDAPEEGSATVVKSKHILRNIVCIVLFICILLGGLYFYQNYYLQEIDSIVLNGNEDSLTVLVTSDVDESLLTVICSDTYGNQIPAPVTDGKAVFNNLKPDTVYNVNVVIEGFHRLTGNTSKAYSTPIQSNIVQFDAVAGSSNGSVILSFTVEGPDSDEWTVVYSAENEKEQTATFEGHMVTLTNLTVDKEYHFSLIPSKELFLSGYTDLTFTTSEIVTAENLTIDSCTNNMLSVSWSAPEGTNVESWTVHCYNDSYNESIITSNTEATFLSLDHTAPYTVEVKAVGMSVGQVVSIPANSITAQNFQINTSDPTKINLTWEPNQEMPDNGWNLRYRIEGIDNEYVINFKENSAVIYPVVPNATYHIQIEDTNGNVLLGSLAEITTVDNIAFSWDFDGYEVSSEDLRFYMCTTPEEENWDRYSLDDEDYKTEFSVGEKASFLVNITKIYNPSYEEVSTMFVIRNQDNTLIQISTDSKPWRDMWYQSYCELDIPELPEVPGDYIIEVYFNGGLANSQSFSIH